MEACPLHEQVFRGDLQAVKKLLETEDPSEKDAHGNEFYVEYTLPAAGNEISPNYMYNPGNFLPILQIW